MSEPLDSRQLNAFVILAKTGSYSQTARQLSLTHSAISHSMRALEANAGCRLLNSVGKKIILTEAGEALLRHARQVLEEMRQARMTLESLNNWGFQRLRVAAEGALKEYFLSGALVKFSDVFPNVSMTVELSTAPDAEQLLESQRVDIVLSTRPAPSEILAFIPLFGDSYHLVVNPRHPGAGRGNIPREELPKHPCIKYRMPPHTQKMMDAHLLKEGIKLNTAVEIDDMATVLDFIKHRPYLAVLPAWSFRRELKEGALVALPLGRRTFDQTWGLTHWLSHTLNHAESGFVKLCMNSIGALA